MRILTYKRTHIGDPDRNGRFGIHNCMGSVRSWDFDAVIGIGGISDEPQSHGIAGRVTWVGRHPKKQLNPSGSGLLVTFESFILLDSKGPLVSDIAPNLARRMYEGRVRTLLVGYSVDEQADAEYVLKELLGSPMPLQGLKATDDSDLIEGKITCSNIRCGPRRRLSAKNSCKGAPMPKG